MEKLSGRQMAAALGISDAAVSKAKRKGMPMDSVEAALQWRSANLVYAMRKDINATRTGTSYTGQTVRAEQLLERLRVLMELGEGAISTGTFETLRGPIRDAMRAVPAKHRDAAHVSIAVMDALLEPVLGPRCQAINEGAADSMSGSAVDEPPSDEAAGAYAWSGRFLYAMACGERFAL